MPSSATCAHCEQSITGEQITLEPTPNDYLSLHVSCAALILDQLFEFDDGLDALERAIERAPTLDGYDPS